MPRPPDRPRGGIGSNQHQTRGVSIQAQREAERAAQYATEASENSKQGLSGVASETGSGIDALLDAHAAVKAEEAFREAAKAVASVSHEETRVGRLAEEKFGVPVKVDIDMGSLRMRKSGYLVYIQETCAKGKARVEGEGLELDVSLRHRLSHHKGNVFQYNYTTFSYKPSFFSRRKKVSTPEELKEVLADHRKRTK